PATARRKATAAGPPAPVTRTRGRGVREGPSGCDMVATLRPAGVTGVTGLSGLAGIGHRGQPERVRVLVPEDLERLGVPHAREPAGLPAGRRSVRTAAPAGRGPGRSPRGSS